MRDAASAVAKAEAASVECRTTLASANHDASEARRRAEDAGQRLSRAEEALARLQMDNAAHVLRARVVVGAPCPVCEREITTQPAAHPPHSLTEGEAAVKRAQKQRSTAHELVVTTAQALARAEGNLATANAAMADGQAKLEQLARELKEALGPELASVEELAKRSAEAAREAKTAQHRAAEAEKTLTSTRTAIAKTEGELQGLPVVAEKLTRRDTLRHQCEAAAAEVERVCGEPPGEKAAARLDEIAGALATAATRTASARDAVAPAEKAVHSLDLERNSLTQQVTADGHAAAAAGEERKALVAERASKESALTAAGIALDGDVLAAIRAELHRLEAAKDSRERLLIKRGELTAKLGSLRIELGTLRGRRLGLEEQRVVVDGDAAKARQELDGAQDRLRQAVAAGKWPGWDAASAAGTEETWLAGIADRARQTHDKAVARDTALSAEVRNFADRLRLANECRARHNEALREATVAGDLGQLLMANRFRKYLLEQAVETLAADGSAHLRELSGGRYTFHTEEADFQIVDGWNADERRSVKTLSGGESFLASLALALGLAEGLPSLGPGEHGHQRLESLFIDEGFGMLDPDETLDTVTQALENLRTDERIVGIVTHLPQLAERLPAQIRVVKSQAGSHVEVVSD
jgi:exonuclease SbcC